MDESSGEQKPLTNRDEDRFTGAGTPVKRLWTPWRMGYVASTPQSSGLPADGCVFCQHLAGNDDPGAFVLYRGQHAFVIMNLYPYNTGHLMLLPNAHVSSPESAPPEAMAEMAAILPGLLVAMRSALNCPGFNTGMNIGEVAGAGIASHLHQHVVPRWPGDANFMPVLAATKVLPELLPVTYAKLRAEIDVRLLQLPLTIVAVANDRPNVLVEADSGRAPVFAAPTSGAVWRAVTDWLGGFGATRVAGWVEDSRMGINRSAIVMECQNPGGSQRGFRWTPVDQVESQDQSLIRRAINAFSPPSAAPDVEQL